MKASILGLSAALLLGATMIASPSTAFAQSALGSAFTYQGQIKLAGEAVNGTADFQFRLFNSSGGSTQIGSTQSASNVAVANGVFTLPLNFGSDAFNGEARWLEIAVRSPAGAGNFVILTPRQPLNAAPYALFAAKPWNMNNNHLTYSGGSVGITGTNANPALSISRNWDNEQGALTLFGDRPTLRFTGGAASGNNSWIAHVGGNGPGALEFYHRVSQNNWAQVMSLMPNGSVGIGTSNPTPLRRLTTSTGEIFTGRFESTHPTGSVIELSNTTGGVWEWGVGGSQPPSGVLPGSMYFYKQGEVDLALAISPNQWIGMGVNNPGFRLDLPNFGNADGRGRANQWVTYSSARWKENVQTLDSALDKVMALRGVSFDWKPEHGGAHDIGFVAEEVGQVVPEIVSWEKDGQWAQGLAYDRITALAVEAIKEQQSQIEDLMQANAEMREQIAQLMRHVPAMNGEVHAQVK